MRVSNNEITDEVNPGYWIKEVYTIWEKVKNDEETKAFDNGLIFLLFSLKKNCEEQFLNR